MTRTAGESWELPQSPAFRKIGRDDYRATRYFMVYQTSPEMAYERAEPSLPAIGSRFVVPSRGISSRVDPAIARSLQARYYDSIGTEGNEHTVIALHYETGPDWTEITGDGATKRFILWEASGASESVTITHKPYGQDIGKRLANPVSITRPLVAYRATAEGPNNNVARLALRHIGKVNSETFRGKGRGSMLLDAVDTQLIGGSDATRGGRGTISRAILTFLWRPATFGWEEVEPQLDDSGDQLNNGEDVVYWNSYPVRKSYDFNTFFSGWIV